jgi:hypothetical protein
MGRPRVKNLVSPAVIDPTQPLPNEIHEKFCIGYLEKGQKVKAYRYACLSDKDKTTDRVNACQMFDLPDIQARIKYLRTKRLSILDIDDDFVLIEQARLAKFDIGKTLNKDGTTKPIQEWGEDLTRCIQSVKLTPAGKGRKEVVEVTFSRKGAALDALMKNRGLFGKNNEQLKPALYLEVGRSEE